MKTKKTIFVRKIYRQIITLALFMVILSMFVACGSKHPSKFVGIWEKTSGNSNVYYDMILRDDGEGTVFYHYHRALYQGYGWSTEPLPITWKVEKKRLYLIGDGLIPEYEYTISDSEITLRTLYEGATAIANYRLYKTPEELMDGK